ncbi:hypothetical protein KKD37_02775 [Patescibacteria group bacterium]|nr:hypothetical protein [Patescibacteria group bacterium]
MDLKSLHHQAEELREQDKFTEALKLYEQVIVAYEQQKDYSSLVEALGGRFLTYKHLYLLEKDQSFAVFAKHDALSALEIVQNQPLGDKQSQCYFHLGEVEMLFKNYQKATDYFQKSLDKYPSKDANQGRYFNHLGEAQYLNGDKKNGLQNLLTGLNIIRQFRESTDSFLINVWESGALLKLFHFTRDKNHLDEAKKIIDSDPRLVIRHRQLDQFLHSKQ